MLGAGAGGYHSAIVAQWDGSAPKSEGSRDCRDDSSLSGTDCMSSEESSYTSSFETVQTTGTGDFDEILQQ